MNVVKEKEEVCPTCGMRVDDCICCPECGRVCALNNGELFCPVCGPVEPKGETEETLKEPPRKR